MADRPILFSAPMVCAILREIEAPGTGKTQTRRVLTTACDEPPALVDHGEIVAFDENDRLYRWPRTAAVGDRLYVRETFLTGFEIDDEYGRPVGDRKVWYRATDGGLTWYDPDSESTLDNPPWKPSIHMPRWASRITLIVTEVRVERLQDCSEADAIAEGIERQEPTDADHVWARQYSEENGCSHDMGGVWIAPGTRQGWGLTPEERDRPQWGPTAAFAYRCMWDQINGPGAWALNPWVAAYTFRPALQNIDQMEPAHA